MKKEMFENILQKDEEIVWMEGINKKAYIVKNIITCVLIFTVVSMFIGTFIAGPATGIAGKNAKDTGTLFFNIFVIVSITIFSLGIIISTIITCLNSKNTFFAITNKRIIKRSGSFNNKFIHYSLKNVGTVEVSGGIFDSKGKDGSASLIIRTKDFHTDTNGTQSSRTLIINSLNKAYKAYSILSEKVDGNNDVLRVKTED